MIRDNRLERHLRHVWSDGLTLRLEGSGKRKGGAKLGKGAEGTPLIPQWRASSRKKQKRAGWGKTHERVPEGS